ncbi:MAG: nitroreductase [Deltaproteobacteria bacterium]|nr:nitroreductase [Deltaproteobacteria bacterium]MBW2214215.1 nitroreductase [Deltaproteobacteria bacterium]MBW2379018.1 nitroreductase [Deltaproteobacteria bacterium]MBW2686111.1 nitroreductase [Deltaproteobacteria bacterium]
MYDLDQTIRERRSVRGFLPRPVPRAVLEEVFGLAQHAPSNCNVQPWRVYVASGDALKTLREALVEAVTTGDSPVMVAPIDEFRGGYRERQIACAVELYSKMGIARDDRVGRLEASLRNFRFFDAPHVAYICMAKSFGIGVALDVGMYVQTLMLAMQSRGVGSCAQASLRSYPDLVSEHLGIPDDEQILCGMSFGYEDTSVRANQTRQPRDPISSNVVFRDDAA